MGDNKKNVYLIYPKSEKNSKIEEMYYENDLFKLKVLFYALEEESYESNGKKSELNNEFWVKIEEI